MSQNSAETFGIARRLIDNVYLFWAALAVPAVYILVQYFILHGRVAYVPLTGDLSGWLLIVTMMITPLMLLLGPLPWLKARRRYLGVASFGYALLHLAYWLSGATVGVLIRSFARPDILAGWIAMGLMVLLAITSNDLSVRKMGVKWKTLQRWIYPVAILTLLHWVFTSHALFSVAVYTVPLILLSIWRLLRQRSRKYRV